MSAVDEGAIDRTCPGCGAFEATRRVRDGAFARDLCTICAHAVLAHGAPLSAPLDLAGGCSCPSEVVHGRAHAARVEYASPAAIASRALSARQDADRRAERALRAVSRTRAVLTTRR